MPNGHKIALFGARNISKFAYAGLASLTFCEIKKEKSDFDFDILKVTEPADYTSLVKAYKNVQRKYNPGKDILIKNKNKLFM